MKLMTCVIWQEQGQWRGYLQDYPDRKMHVESWEGLQARLSRFHGDRAGGKISGLQRIPRAA
jgi:hypothetical protein